jgi:hypothetical protein
MNSLTNYKYSSLHFGGIPLENLMSLGSLSVPIFHCSDFSYLGRIVGFTGTSILLKNYSRGTNPLGIKLFLS